MNPYSTEDWLEEHIQRELKHANITQKKVNTIVYMAIEAITLLKKLGGETPPGANLGEILDYLKDKEMGFCTILNAVNYARIEDALLISYTVDLLVKYKKLILLNRANGGYYSTKAASLSLASSPGGIR